MSARTDLKMRTDLKSRIARALAAHAEHVAEPEHAEWTNAMVHELEHLPPGTSALSWALGCVSVSYRGRLRAMKLPDLPLWALLLLMLGPSAEFIHIVVSTAQGIPIWPGAQALPYSLMQEGLIFGSAKLIGPVGLVAVLWTLSSPARRPGTIFMVVLWTLTALGALYAVVPALSAEWRALATPLWFTIWQILFNSVLLPAIAVAQLQRLDLRRRLLVTQGQGSPLLEAATSPANPMLSVPNLGALGLGVLSYLALAAIIRWLLPQPSHLDSADLLTNGNWLIHVVLLILLVSPGIVLGMVATRSPAMHGVLLGVLIVGLMTLLILVASSMGVKDSAQALYPFGSLAVSSAVALLIGSSLGAMLGASIGRKLRGV